MFEQAFKNIDDILYKDAGADSELGAISDIRDTFIGFQEYLYRDS